MGIPTSMRLRRACDFQQVRSQGMRILCGPFIFQCRRLADAGNQSRRFGVVASRRVGGAVKRNYGKRVFREIFRRHASALPSGCDLVVVLRSSFDRYGFDNLEARFLRACGKLSEAPPTATDNNGA